MKHIAIITAFVATITLRGDTGITVLPGRTLWVHWDAPPPGTIISNTVQLKASAGVLWAPSRMEVQP